MVARLDGTAARVRPTAPRPRAKRGRRLYPPVPVDWPHPPDGRPRFAHHRLTEEFNGGMGVTFRTYADGHVVAYGRASDRDRAVAQNLPDDQAAPPVDESNPNDWVVVVWRGHPLLMPNRAELLRYLVDRASYADALRVLDEWELTG